MSDAARDQLLATASFLSGRLTLYCQRCELHCRLTLKNRGLKIPPSDSSYPARANRVNLFCTSCGRSLGYVAAFAPEGATSEEPRDNRWHRLELDEQEQP